MGSTMPFSCMYMMHLFMSMPITLSCGPPYSSSQVTLIGSELHKTE